MADEPAPAPAPTTDTAGIARTPDGQITAPAAAAPSSLSTTPPTSTPGMTPTEPKADDGKTLLSDKDKAPAGAPETYADYKVPEGFTLDPEIRTEADKLFKDTNLTQDQAQKFVDFYTAKAKEAFEAPFEAYQETRKEWRQQAENDPSLRGKLTAGGEVLTTVAKALDSLGDPKLASDFREAMDLTGVGDHPAFIKTFFRMAQRLTEGTPVVGRGPSAAGQQRPGTADVRSPAQDLWPNLPSASRG